MDDPYSILGLYPDCSYEEAKAAYRKAALMHHPDRHPPARKAEAERRFRIFAHAFQLVCKDLGHPINSSLSKNSNPSNTNTKKSQPINSSLVKSRSVSQPQTSSNIKSIDRSSESSKTLKSINSPSEPPKKIEDQRPQPAQSTDNSPIKMILSDGSHPTYPPQDLLDNLPEFTTDSSFLEGDHEDNCLKNKSFPPPSHPVNRRSSFSHPSQRQSHDRAMVNDHSHSMAAKQGQQYEYPHREQLYAAPPRRNRDQDWDFGLGGDGFFSSGIDRFGATGAMMDGIGLGFDRMMSSAFQGLSMAGPDPDKLAQMEHGDNCSMRMRQSKMVMGRTEDGSWAGKKMEKSTSMANGRLEVSENAQDIKMGGNPSGSANRYPPPRNGNTRRGEEVWDSPPAYQRGGPDHYGEEEYEPYVPIGSAHRMEPGIAPSRQHGSLSHSSRGNLRNMGGYYDQPNELQRRPSSRSSYGPHPGHLDRLVGRDVFVSGHPPMGHSLARRPSGEIGTRY